MNRLHISSTKLAATATIIHNLHPLGVAGDQPKLYPAEVRDIGKLDHWSRQRRRARQTHPGKRSKA